MLCTHVGIEAKTRGECDGQVGESAHEEGGDSGNSGGGCDEVQAGLSDTGEVDVIVHTEVARWADARTA